MQAPEYRRNYELEQHYWWFVGIRAMVHELLSLSLGQAPLGRVLDVGCGTGALLDELRPRAQELWGLDVSPEGLRFCARRGGHNLICADGSRTPFPASYFDVVTAIGIVEHLDDDAAFLTEMNRVLQPDGVLILLTSSFPFLWSMHDTANEHRRRYYLRSLNQRINAIGFATLRFSHLNFFTFPALAPALLVHRLCYGTKPEHTQRLLPIPPRPINAILSKILKTEARLMRRIRLPWGISMIGAFRKKTAPSAAPARTSQDISTHRISVSACHAENAAISAALPR
ncbi:MAG: class I SAM-dependent methyltransferase [bacterium]|nr:class I SAM-dependent methyltransferase [bacterium]